MEQTDDKWDKIRQTAISAEQPPNWPPQIGAISMNGLALLGVDRENKQLCWDGQKLITEKRFSSFERALAVVGLVFGGVGALSAAALTVIEIGRVCKWWS